MKPTNNPARTKINLLILAYISFVTVGLPSGLLGVAWPTLRAEFSLPLDAMGFLLFSSTIGYLISSFFIARLIHRFGIGPLLIFSSVASALALAGYTVAPAWSVIVAISCMGGFGLGVMDAGLNTYLASEYNEGQMQWLHACYGIGATLSPIIMTASLAQFSAWRPGYIFVAILTASMAIGFWLTLSAWKKPQSLSTENKDRERGVMDYQTSIWETLIQPFALISILMFLLYTGAEVTLGDWTYTLLTESRGVNPQLAGLWAGGFWATFTIGRVLAGLYARRIQLNVLMLGEMTFALMGAILFWWNLSAWISIGGLFLVGFAMAPIFPGLVSSTSDRVGTHHAANTIGIQISAAALGGAVLPSLAGVLARRISLETIPIMLSISLLGLLALYWLSMRVKKES